MHTMSRRRLAQPAGLLYCPDCTQVTSTSLLLHYHSRQPGLWPLLVGILKSVTKKVLGHELEMRYPAVLSLVLTLHA